MQALEVSGLTIEHARSGYVVHPIHDLDARANDGELVLVLGPGGCGKTTLLSCIAGLLAPARGSIRVGDTEVTALRGPALAEFRRRRVGIVFRGSSLIASLTVAENVASPLRLGGAPRRRATARGEDLLKRVGLDGLGDRAPAELSSGERQLAAVARAMVHDPELILADEPAAGLDYVEVEEVLSLLREIASPGRLVLVATQDRRLRQLADRVIDLTPRAGLDDDGVRTLSLAAGERLFRQGDHSDLVYVVERGQVEVYRERVDGSEELRATFGPGEYFGELGPLLSLPRAASVRATETTVLTSYGTDAFRAWRASGAASSGRRPSGESQSATKVASAE